MKRIGSIAVPLVLSAVGIVFLCIGISQGQMAEVLQKAIRICLECIGIG